MDGDRHEARLRQPSPRSWFSQLTALSRVIAFRAFAQVPEALNNRHKIQGLYLTVALVLLREVIINSPWNTRGLTYQELMLSHWCLCFTPRHVPTVFYRFCEFLCDCCSVPSRI
jgi:hypothetical protein